MTWPLLEAVLIQVPAFVAMSTGTSWIPVRVTSKAPPLVVPVIRFPTSVPVMVRGTVTPSAFVRVELLPS